MNINPYPNNCTKFQYLAWCCYYSGMQIRDIAYSLDCSISSAHDFLKQAKLKGQPLRPGSAWRSKVGKPHAIFLDTDGNHNIMMGCENCNTQISLGWAPPIGKITDAIKKHREDYVDDEPQLTK